MRNDIGGSGMTRTGIATWMAERNERRILGRGIITGKGQE